MILADLELLRKVWKKVAMPIWANIHPNSTTAIIGKGVYLKKLFLTTK